MVSGSSALTMVVTGRRSLLVGLSLVLIALLAFPPSALRASAGADVLDVPTSAMSAGHEDGSPCHHARVGDSERAVFDAPSSHDHGSAHDHAIGTDHHGSGGCCPMSLCAGTCSSACSGAGAGAVFSGTLTPSVSDAAALLLVGRTGDMVSGTHGTPYRPPRAEPAIAG